MKKVKVSIEVAEALDRLDKNEDAMSYDLISHCKSFSGNGHKMRNSYTEDFKALEEIKPLEFARCLLFGYETHEEKDTEGVSN